MRTLNSAKNLFSGIGISIITILLGFFTRKIFVDNIGVEYLGLNGLLQNILGAMTIIESGFATSVVYNMYKPIANDDRPRVIALLQLYRKVYRYMALGVFICAMAIYPFIDFFIKDAESLHYLSIVYMIFLFNSLIQYFTAYKQAIINANQKNYKLALINIVYQIGLYAAKIFILFYTQNYILYLVVESLFGLCLNVAIVRKADKLYPYIKTKVKYIVEPDVRKNIITNMKALFFSVLGGYFMHSTDNIVMSAYIGVVVVGLYSNYTLLLSTIKTLVSQVLNSYSESVGNLIAVETKDKIYDVFRTAFFVNFLAVSIPVIVLYNTITPFIDWWLGEEYELPYITMCIILFNFYVDMMRSSALTFKFKSGIFVPDRFTALLQGLINLVLSIWFVKYWGISGVLLATGISIMAIGFWQWPRLIYRHTFERPLYNYFRTYFIYTIIGLIALVVSSVVCNTYEIENRLLYAVFSGLVTIIITVTIYFIAFHKTFPYKELQHYVRTVIQRKK
ncbi:MAG: oligosaccharide flippase family protein [Muribaculaceae bacterium]|nr:oligosaccharide flippase family protein [Muribaculaceae bacterium]